MDKPLDDSLQLAADTDKAPSEDLSKKKLEPRPQKRICMRTPTGLDQWSAPETRQGADYTEAVDMWGVGVIIYHVIARHAPFVDHDEQRLLERVQNCEYEPLSEECIGFYSPEIIDFVRELIVADPAQRMTALQALELPWLQDVIAIQYDTEPVLDSQGPPAPAASLTEPLF